MTTAAREGSTSARPAKNGPVRSDAAPEAIRLTIGAGKNRPQGRIAHVDGGVAGLASWLNEREPEGLNTWWSFHSFLDDYCSADRYPTEPTEPGFPKRFPWLAGKGGWTGAWGVGIDVDHCSSQAEGPKHKHTKSAPPADLIQRLEEAVRKGELPGNLYHRTAHGFRFAFVFDRECTTREEYARAAAALHEMVRQALVDLEFHGCPGVHVDDLRDLRRMFWAPRGWCLGPDGKREKEERNAQVIVMRPESVRLADVAKATAPEPSRPVRRRKSARVGTTDLEEAVRRYNADRSRELPRNGGECPMCGKGGRFGQLPKAPERWSCFGASHPEVGCAPSTPGGPWTGDVLDLDTYERFGRTGDGHKRARIELLRAEGYLSELRAGTANGATGRASPAPEDDRGDGHGDHPEGGSQQADREWPVLHHDALHGPAGDFVSAVEPHTEADSAALLVQFLVALGNAIGRSPYFPVEGDRHHTNLNAVMVGRTSKGRKGTSWGRVRQFYAQVDSAWVKGREVSGLSSGEGLIWQVRDPVYEADEDGDEKMVDAGVDDKRLMVLEAEFASSLRVSRRETNILSAVIRTAWDTGTLRTLTKNSPAVATDAHISIIGHITKDELLRHLDATEMANGFANRFLWVCVQRSKCLPEGGSLEESALSSFYSCIRNTLEAARRVGQMCRSEAARSLWRGVYERLSEGEAGLFGAITSRAEAQVTRLSCIYALLDGSSVIEVPHLKAALALWDYCEQSCRYIFGDALGNPIADRILQALRGSPKGLNRSQISHLLGRNEAASAIDNALRVLLEHKLAAKDVVKTGGRPEERWYAVTKQTKETNKGVGNGVSNGASQRPATRGAL